MMRNFFINGVIFGGFASLTLAVDIPAPSDAPAKTIKAAEWVFLDNGIIRLGVKKTAGAAIGWLSRSGSPTNLLDHWDEGRFIQQSYYGDTDGSLWVKDPWRWNPVQGGDYQGHPAQVREFTNNSTMLQARIYPRNWAGGQLLTNCEMQETIRLAGAVAIVKFGFEYHGTNAHPVRQQEVPAAFIAPAYGTMVIYEGNQPWTDGPLTRSRPGWPNESRKISEGWFAWVNDQNTGVGVYSPVARQLTCYRFGASPPAAGACSYAAPLVEFAITPEMHFEYELALAVGTPQAMRAEFMKLKDSLPAKPPTAGTR